MDRYSSELWLKLFESPVDWRQCWLIVSLRPTLEVLHRLGTLGGDAPSSGGGNLGSVAKACEVFSLARGSSGTQTGNGNINKRKNDSVGWVAGRGCAPWKRPLLRQEWTGWLCWTAWFISGSLWALDVGFSAISPLGHWIRDSSYRD